MGKELRAGLETVGGYTLVERLGKGGFGEVWKATGPGGFQVALKFVALADDAGPAELRSLEVIKDIRHPHLLATFGSWRDDGRLIIAMELAGRTLLDRFRESAGQGFPGIPAPEIFEHFLDASKALDFLNEPRHPSGGSGPLGIQHRDVKPQNLLLVGGSVKVADFGLARALEHTADRPHREHDPGLCGPGVLRAEDLVAVGPVLAGGHLLPAPGGAAAVPGEPGGDHGRAHAPRARPLDDPRGRAPGRGPGPGQVAPGPLAELPGVRLGRHRGVRGGAPLPDTPSFATAEGLPTTIPMTVGSSPDSAIGHRARPIREGSGARARAVEAPVAADRGVLLVLVGLLIWAIKPSGGR